jgi:NADH:ubiquinone oxidoreductase subunit 4 (subunit M)
VNLGKIPDRWADKEFADVHPIEMAAWAPLLVLILLLGIVPRILLDVTNGSVVDLVRTLTG